MKARILFAALLLLSLFARAQDDVFLIDPIIEVPSEETLTRFSTMELKDWGWTMMNPTQFHNAGHKGAGTVIFVIDTGIEADHEDLRGKVIGRRNWTSDTEVTNGHGTWCASRIAALENGLGGIGIAPDVVLYDLQVLSGSGSGSSTNVAAAYRYAADVQLPAPYNSWLRVTSASLGSSSPMTSVQQAMDYANAKGVIHVAAAGNSYREGENTVNCPGCYERNSITVAAIDTRKAPAYFSSAGEQVDVAAPGVSLDGAWTGGTYRKASGTSMATPAVAASIALFRNENPDLNSQELAEAFVKKYATDAHTPGFDTRTGHGIVLLPAYFGQSPPNDPGEPNDPPTDPDPDPDPVKPVKARIVTIPIQGKFNVLWKGSSAGKFSITEVFALTVEYRTDEPLDRAVQRAQEAVEDYFTNRGYVLPDECATDDWAVGYAAYFMNLILGKEGMRVNLVNCYGTSASANTLYYSDENPVRKPLFPLFVDKATTLTW